MSIKIVVKFIKVEPSISFTFIKPYIIPDKPDLSPPSEDSLANPEAYHAALWRYNIRTKIANMNQLIHTRLLLENNTLFRFPIKAEGQVRYKYELRKYIKTRWNIKTKYLKKIKHLNTINNLHNYIVILYDIPTELKIYKDSLASYDTITWRSFFEPCKINKPLSDIYFDMSQTGFKTKLPIDDTCGVGLGDIYSLISDNID